jgi:Asp/Glu/hydantoin racemase
MTGRPVVGLAEAAMRQAAAHGRFAIVTGGAAWKPMLERLARSLGLAEALALIHLVAPTGAQMAADPDAALVLLRDACREASAGVQSVILGGAALAGMAATLAPALDVPLIDSVSAGAEAVVAAASSPPAGTQAPASSGMHWHGMSAALLQILR